jgi:hypothetical protein
MKKFSHYIKEDKNSKNDILIIVDVQKEFNDFIPQGFVKSLIKYCENFHTIYQIWDSNAGQKNPSYTFPNEKLAIIKKFGTKFSDELDETVAKLNKKYPNAKEGDVFNFDDINSYVVRVKNQHSWFYVPEKMANLFKSLKGKNITVVGGAKNECIQDVFESMESFGIKVKYDERYLYSAKTNNTQIFNIQNQKNII